MQFKKLMSMQDTPIEWPGVVDNVRVVVFICEPELALEFVDCSILPTPETGNDGSIM